MIRSVALGIGQHYLVVRESPTLNEMKGNAPIKMFLKREVFI